MSDAQLTGADPSLAAQTIFTNDSRVACNGGGGALGHPRVYLEMGGEAQVECPYCDRLFVYDPEKARQEKPNAAASG